MRMIVAQFRGVWPILTKQGVREIIVTLGKIRLDPQLFLVTGDGFIQSPLLKHSVA